MALSYTQITLVAGSGTNGIDNTEFTFSFPYLNTGDIKAIISLNPTHATPTWTDILTNSGASSNGATFDTNGIDIVNKQIKLNATPAASSSAVADSALRIYRSTTQDPLVDFQGGSRLAEADLDTSYRQGLYAAQEVTENASTRGVAGGAAALTTGSVLVAHMSDNSVDSDQYVDASIDMAHIADNAVGVDQLTDNLDLSSHIVTLNATTLNLAGGQFGGILPEARGGTGLSAKPPGTILECVTGPCDGTARSAVSGADHTLPAGAARDLTNTMADMDGSLFEYRAPTGTAQVCYELNFNLSKDVADGKGHAMFKLFLGVADGDPLTGAYTEVTYAKFAVGTGIYYGSRVHFKWTFPVGHTAQYGSGSGNAPNVGAVASWGKRHIKLMGRVWNTSGDNRYMKWNQLYLWDDATSNATDSATESVLYTAPVITVTAIK